MQLNIIGPGRVGRTLGKLFIQHKIADIGAVYSRTSASSRAGVEFLGKGAACVDLRTMPHAKLTMLTVADDNISELARQYSESVNIKPGDIVFHCSGVLSSQCMQALQARGCMVCSIHPMHSFIEPSISIDTFAGTYCALEGDEAAIDLIADIFSKLGAKVFKVDREHKALYHAAGVFASNYMLTLAQQSLDCLHSAKVEKDVAMNLVVSLMQSTLNNLALIKDPKSALTGPLKRGDDMTVAKHIAAFDSQAARDFYKFLVEKTRSLLLS